MKRGLKKGADTYPQPFRPLGAKTETFETQTNAGLAVIVFVGLFVAFLCLRALSALVYYAIAVGRQQHTLRRILQV